MTEDSQFQGRSTLENLKNGLINLPKPQFEYDIEIPELEDEEDQERMKKIDAHEEELIIKRKYI